MSREEEKSEEARITGKDRLNLKSIVEEEEEDPYANLNLDFGKEEERDEESGDCKESDIFSFFSFFAR